MLEPRFSLRLVFDTAMLFSFVLADSMKMYRRLFKQREITLVYSEPLLSEFAELAQRQPFSQWLTAHEVADLLELMLETGELFEPEDNINRCPSPEGNHLLALAVEAHADFVVTADQALLALGGLEDTAIINADALIFAIQRGRHVL